MSGFDAPHAEDGRSNRATVVIVVTRVGFMRVLNWSSRLAVVRVTRISARTIIDPGKGVRDSYCYRRGDLAAVLQELVFDSLPEGAVWPFDRTYIRPPHFHGQLECLVVTRGTATLYLGTRPAVVRAGQLCWVLPGVP